MLLSAKVAPLFEEKQKSKEGKVDISGLRVKFPPLLPKRPTWLKAGHVR